MKSFLFALLLMLLVAPHWVWSQREEAPSDFLYATRRVDTDIEYALHVIDAASGTIADIARIRGYSSDAGWSPDGKYIYIIDALDDGSRVLKLFDVDSGSQRTVTSKLIPDRCTVPLSWSPDGRFLAFFDAQESLVSLQILDTEDDLVHTLPYAVGVYAPLIWSPDGRYLSLLLKVSDDEPYAIAIWDMMSGEMMMALDSGEFYKFSWSPDAEYVTFIPEDAEREFAVLNIVTKELRLYDGSWGEAWSPNGRYLIHYRKAENDGSQTFVLDTVEDEIFQLGDAQSDTVFHAWSPDSRYVVYETRSAEFNYMPEDRRWETPMKFLQVYDLTTQKTFTIDLTGNFYRPGRWSAQGQILAYTSGMDFVGEVNRLMVVDMVAGKIHEFGADPGELIYDRPPRWSPDGRYFDLWTQQGISIYDHQTELLRPVTESLVSASSLGWSAGGHYLGVYSIADDNPDIYVVDTADDLRLRNLTNTPKEREFVIGWRGTGRNASLIHCGIG